MDDAVNAFDNTVVYEAKVAGWWAPFDQYCSYSYWFPNAPLPTSSTYPYGYSYPFSQAKPNQDCELQHDSEYPGPSRDEVAADLFIGPNGQYEAFVGATTSTATCSVNVSYSLHGFGPDASVGISFSWSDYDPDITLARAKAIDKKAIQCLNSTRP
jgi:hypothetical protein